MTAIVEDIFRLFARFGAGRYGEDLSLETHMLQSAAMADSQGAPPHIVIAALLHDIGYFLYSEAESSVESAHDFQHEAIGAAWLSQAFDESITTPIALHVPAKRYLCAVESGYFDQLSDMSRLTLVTQGGVMNESEVAAFAQNPACEAALLLRRCDDRGKDLSVQVPGLERYRGLLTGCLR